MSWDVDWDSVSRGAIVYTKPTQDKLARAKAYECRMALLQLNLVLKETGVSVTEPACRLRAEARQTMDRLELEFQELIKDFDDDWTWR